MRSRRVDRMEAMGGRLRAIAKLCAQLTMAGGRNWLTPFHIIMDERGWILHLCRRCGAGSPVWPVTNEDQEMLASTGRAVTCSPETSIQSHRPQRHMLADRWFNLCEKAGLDGRAAWTVLAGFYGEPARAYHNMNHITDCLLRFDEHAHLAADAAAVEFAIWFHDIVYDTRAADNEERSAVFAAEFLSGTPLGTVVADLIRATKHESPPATPDAALLCDIDLSILGRGPVEYDAYARAVREEYGWVPFPQYAEARTRVLEGFLARPTLFVLGELEERFGEQARVNLAREICCITAPAACPDQTHPENRLVDIEADGPIPGDYSMIRGNAETLLAMRDGMGLGIRL